jgi:hypothetical protein
VAAVSPLKEADDQEERGTFNDPSLSDSMKPKFPKGRSIKRENTVQKGNDPDTGDTDLHFKSII